MASVLNFDSTGDPLRAPVVMLAELIVVQALKENADEIIFTLKSRAEWISDTAKEAPMPDAAKIEKVESVPPVQAQPILPAEKTTGATMEEVIAAAKLCEELEAKAGGSPMVEDLQVVDLVYVIPGRGRVHYRN